MEEIISLISKFSKTLKFFMNFKVKQLSAIMTEFKNKYEIISPTKELTRKIMTDLHMELSLCELSIQINFDEFIGILIKIAHVKKSFEDNFSLDYNLIETTGLEVCIVRDNKETQLLLVGPVSLSKKSIIYDLKNSKIESFDTSFNNLIQKYIQRIKIEVKFIKLYISCALKNAQKIGTHLSEKIQFLLKEFKSSAVDNFSQFMINDIEDEFKILIESFSVQMQHLEDHVCLKERRYFVSKKYTSNTQKKMAKYA